MKKFYVEKYSFIIKSVKPLLCLLSSADLPICLSPTCSKGASSFIHKIGPQKGIYIPVLYVPAVTVLSVLSSEWKRINMRCSVYLLNTANAPKLCSKSDERCLKSRLISGFVFKRHSGFVFPELIPDQQGFQMSVQT